MNENHEDKLTPARGSADCCILVAAFWGWVAIAILLVWLLVKEL